MLTDRFSKHYKACYIFQQIVQVLLVQGLAAPARLLQYVHRAASAQAA